MLGLFIALLVIALLVFMLYKSMSAQAALFISAILLMIAAIAFDLGPIIDHKKSLGFSVFDIFEVFKNKMSSTLSGLGLTLMSIAGFSAYMEHIGASNALFNIFQRPLNAVKSPYILLVASFFIVQILVIFIPSHAGLALLLMVMLYPILIRTGVSKLSALAVIGTCQFIDHGPASGNVVMASSIAHIDPAVYFVNYQLPITIPIIIAVAVTNFFVQRYFDKKDKFVFDKEGVEKELSLDESGKTVITPPKIYAILPIIPRYDDINCDCYTF